MDMDKPIRVLHVVTIMHRAGLETRLMDIYRHIDRSLIQFDFLTHRMEDGDYDDEIRTLGGVVYHIPGTKPWNLIGYIRNLKSFFDQHSSYKIIHVHLNTYSGWVQYAAKKAGIPVRITHSRGAGIDHNWKMFFKLMSKWIVNYPTTHKFACSEQAGIWLFGRKGVLSSNKFLVIPNGIDLSKFSFSKEKRLKMRNELHLKDELVLVNVGRLSKAKNHLFLLEIFSVIHSIYSNSKLFLIGEGELREIIKHRIKSLELDQCVTLVGSISNVGDYLQAMDGMLFPSLCEGFGTVVLESQCCGLPTLASDVLPPNTIITECLELMTLKEPPEVWANKMINMCNRIKRKDRSAEIRAAGFDIKDTYKLLSDFYLSHT